MKRKILLLLVLGASMFFFGCSKMDTLAPELNQNDNLTSSLKKGKMKTAFTGITTPVNLETGEWYENTTDSRITGQSFWTTTKEKIQKDRTRLVGTAEIIVDNGGGKWELSWHGWLTPNPENPDVFIVKIDAMGRGIEGSVDGLIAKWKYTLDISEGFFYSFEGYIIEKK